MKAANNSPLMSNAAPNSTTFNIRLKEMLSVNTVEINELFPPQFHLSTLNSTIFITLSNSSVCTRMIFQSLCQNDIRADEKPLQCISFVCPEVIRPARLGLYNKWAV